MLQLLTSAGRLGANGLGKLARNSRNLRVGPVLTVAILSYIESRETCDFDPFGIEGSLLSCKKFPTTVTRRNLGKWDNLIERVLQGKVTGNVNGALFHLLALASHQLEFELGISNLRPIAQEFTTEMTVQKVSTPKNKPITLDRDIDILLSAIDDGKAETLIDRDVDEMLKESIWVEIKSLGRNSLGAPQWTVGAGRTTRHRQFALDCSAKKNSSNTKSKGFRWWLQDWKPRGSSKALPPLPKPHLETMNKNLHKIPNKAIKSDYGLILNDKKICPEVDAKLFTITNKLIDTMTLTLKEATVDAVKANLSLGSFQ